MASKYDDDREFEGHAPKIAEHVATKTTTISAGRVTLCGMQVRKLMIGGR